MSYFEHLSKDKKLASILPETPLKLRQRKKVYLHLCGSIMSQQLSTKVADVLWNRFLALFGEGEPTPEQIVALNPTVLRGIGLSNAKVAYVQNVARFAIEQGMEWKQLKNMSDEEVIAHLTQIKGVGRWTTEMLLMFALGREDVFAIDDFGIQQAMIRLYKLDNSDRKAFRAKMLQISAKWSPYRTYACLHLWRWKDA
ncbi:MAG TPA: DNA-3-methyladenine glycosylase 2 family protein [Flavihumibacter sp.]|nr:DNA-3-methyladenine glycosylase 2 family protein [Flavihumibacter sp.]